MKIVNLGSLNLDHVYRVDRFLVPGETKASKGLMDNAGGKGLNQSVAASRTGAVVCHAGYWGSGCELLRTSLEDAGVNLELMEERPDIPCGHTIIQVNDEGQNCILLFGGTNMCLTEEYIDRVLDRCTPEDILLLQNETNLIPYIIETAAKRGISTAMNAAPMDDGVKEYPIGKLRYLIVNEIEGAALAGGDSFDQTMENLCVAYPGVGILLTLGGDGAWFRDGSRDIRIGCAKVSTVVDTTAAGDTFLGYFLAGMLDKLDPAQALRRATYASALTIQKPGAADSIPSRVEVEAVMASGVLGDLELRDSAN